MADNGVEKYADLTDELFCRPHAEYGDSRFVREGPPTVIVSGLMARVSLYATRDTSERYEVTYFDGIDGFAGDLWERSTKTLLRARSLNHSGIPEIVTARFIPERRIAFTLTRQIGTQLDLDEAVRWASESPLEAFEQFSVLLDALRELHGAHIMHRGVLPGAFRTSLEGGRQDGQRQLSLTRFEMSSLISNIIRRVIAGDAGEVRDTVRQIYLTPEASVDPARHLAYLAPEMHRYVFEDGRSRRDWDTTDLFGLGVLGWELFCGGLPAVLPDELAAVRAAEGRDRVAALERLHRAMRVHLTNDSSVPAPLRRVLLDATDPHPESRSTCYDLTLRLEQDWVAIRSTWEAATEQSPYLVAFMPNESIETIYQQRHWIPRSPQDAAGREALQAFFERELRQAVLVHSRFGARGYATGADDTLREAEWVLIGERAVWFCSYLREYAGPEPRLRTDVLLVKYLREHETAKELYEAQPRRQVPAIELIPFRPDQTLGRSHGPSWTALTESVRQRRQRDPDNEKFLESLDFLIDYQQTELEARTYPFRLEESVGNRYAIRHDVKRDSAWLHRSPLLTAFASTSSRRPPLGDYASGLEDDRGSLFQVDSRADRPAFTNDTLVVEFLRRRDQDTIEVRPVAGGRVPESGWLRPAQDQGTRAQLSRQMRATQMLRNQPGLIRTLREPDSFAVSRQYAQAVLDPGLLGNAPSVISRMLTLQPFFALQGPPGSGKTHAVTRAISAYLKAEAGSRVLVSAQSNFALDNLGERLVKALPDILVLRHTAEGRENDNVDVKLLPHTLGNMTEAMVAEVERRLSGDRGREVTDPSLSPEQVALGENLARQWLSNIRSNQIELSERIRAGASVVLATTSMAATVLEGWASLTDSFDWVIVEEAAKAWPTEVVIPLVLGTRWTLVGDHRQLGAYRGDAVRQFLTSLGNHPSEEVRRHFDAMTDRLAVLDLFKSLFEPSVKERLAADAPGLDRLTMQFRMHGDIAEPVRRAFYPLEPTVLDRDGLPESFLESHPSTREDHGVIRPNFLAGRALVWLDTDGLDDCVDEPRWSNEGEVALIDDLVAKMDPAPAPAGRDGPNSLVVLSPYRRQCELLRRRDTMRDRVFTVHSFQGREADRVVVSLVRTRKVDDDPTHNVGHVGKNEVANVLLSRACRLLVLVGSLPHFTANAGEAWNLITQVVRRYGTVVRAAEWRAS